MRFFRAKRPSENQLLSESSCFIGTIKNPIRAARWQLLWDTDDTGSLARKHIFISLADGILDGLFFLFPSLLAENY